MKKAFLMIATLMTFTVPFLQAQSLTARTVRYVSKDVVPVDTKVRFTSLIVLPAKERILDFVVGDKDYWVVEGAQNFAYVKPSKTGAETNLTLITQSGNIYSFLLKEVGESGRQPDMKLFVDTIDPSMVESANATPKFVPAAEITKIQDQALAAEKQSQESKEEFRADYPIKGLRFDYKFERDKKPFLVSAIFHDDKFTYIHCRAQEMPSLYEVRDGKPNLINFDLEDGVYIVPKILDQGYLAIGKHRLPFERHD